ncbi:MAG TPA: hypothetical protein VIG78_06100, partial [Gemmatimonadaceae bacterium]
MRLVLAILVSATSLFAGELVPLGVDSTTVAQRVEQLRAVREHHQQSRRIAPNVVSVDWEKESFIIPVAGSVQGGNGTFFKSDVTIANRRAVPQLISIGFLVRGTNNGSAPTQKFTIDANTTTITRDFIATQLHT